jgi:predicted dehydrogenase
VYVATEHTAHLTCARLALEGGKHTLVEKPIGLDTAQAAEISDLAATQGLFCAEALWTLFLPKFDVVRQILESGVLGDVHTVLADLGEHFGPGHRILRPELAGGPLLDLGTYPVSLATWVLGPPARVQASGQPHPAGVNGRERP